MIDSEQTDEFYQEIAENGRSDTALRIFRGMIHSYFQKGGRSKLPWRLTTNPYHIFVSEIMLQQTQVERVIPKYERFIAAFPDFQSLACAPLDNILTIWQGLGYNRRAKYLREGAERVMVEYEGSLPRRPEILITFPGLGHATACSIATFAFNVPTVFIETNIRRVFIHFFFTGENSISDRDIIPLVERSLDRSHPREWYYALMG